MHPTIQFLKALGYQEGDRITGRNMLATTGKSNDWWAILTTDNLDLTEYRWQGKELHQDGKHHIDGLAWLAADNRKHKQIYFNVNGGRRNAEITQARAVFFENDRGSFAEQQAIIDKFPIPPTAVVRTRKSKHTYYQLTEGDRSLNGWKQLQEQMSLCQGSDPAVKDGPRLMRLPGFSHVKLIDGKFDYVLCELEVKDGDRTYSKTEIIAAMEAASTQPYSDTRYRAYNFAQGKMNLTKQGYGYPLLNPEMFRECEPAKLDELYTRARLYVRLVDSQHRRGEDTNPESAWSEPLPEVQRRHKVHVDIATIPAPFNLSDALPGSDTDDITLVHRWARLYGYGWSRAGQSGARQNWDTCQCPVHGSSSNSTDNLHINRSDSGYQVGSVSCKSGCEPDEIIAEFRRRAKDADDASWNWNVEGGNNTPDTEAPEIEPDPEEYQAYQAHLEEEELNAEAEEQERQRQWRDQYPDRVKSHYKRHRRYTPTEQQNNCHVQFSTPAPNTIMGVRSGLGTGKTHQLKQIKDYLQSLGEGGLLLSDRNGLLYQTCERLGITHLQRDKAWNQKQHPDSWLALCPDSLIHFTDEELHGRNLVIDEAQSVIETLLMGKTLSMKRDKVINRFEYLIKNAKRILLLDGYLTDWLVDYIAKIRGGIVNIIKVGNDYIPPRPPVEFLTGSVNSFGKLCKRDYSSFLTQLLPKQFFTLDELNENSAEGKRRCAIPMDTQVGAEALDKILTELGFVVLRIDSKTVNQSHIKAICDDPNTYFRNHPEVDFFVYTPTIESGFDVSVSQTVQRVDTQTGAFYNVEMPYFTDVYGIFVGTLTTNRQMQMLGRVRQCNRIHVFCAPFAPTSEIHSQFATTATRDLMRYLSNDVTNITADGLVAEFEKCKKTVLENKDTPHQEAWGILKSILNHEKTNLRECLKDALIDAGYEVNEVSADYNKEHAARWRDSKLEVKKQNSADRYNADEISLEAAEGLATNYSSSWEEQCQIWKAKITQKYLPGIADSASWSEDFCYWIGYEQRHWIKQQELFWMLHHPEVALLMQRQRWASRVKRSQTFLPDIRSRYSQVKALRSIRIEQWITDAVGKEYHKDSPEIVSFISRLTPALQLALGIKVGNSAGVQAAGRVLELIGYELKYQGQRRDADGNRVRYYSVQPINNEEGTADYRADTLEAIDRKWGNYIQNAQPVEWERSEDIVEAVVTPAVSLVNITGEGVTQVINTLSTTPTSGAWGVCMRFGSWWRFRWDGEWNSHGTMYKIQLVGSDGCFVKSEIYAHPEFVRWDVSA
ncbi:plasmid replication protein, CyRepA1 family [Phormidium nigroviride]